MADEIFSGKSGKEKSKLVASFRKVVEGTKSAQGHTYLSLKDAEAIAAAQPGLIEINQASKDDKGNVAVRATTDGVSAHDTLPAKKERAPKVEIPKMDFKIEKGIPVPPILRGGAARESQYPFAQLEVGDTFFVPKSEAVPDPAKALASTVGSATKKEKGKGNGKDGQDKKYVMRKRTQERDGEEGARIWRTV